MLTAEQWGYALIIILALIVALIGWNVYVEVGDAIDRHRQRRVHQKNVEAWNRLFRCDDDGVSISRPEDTQVINLPMVRTPEELGNDYAFAMAIRYLHADEKELLNV